MKLTRKEKIEGVLINYLANMCDLEEVNKVVNTTEFRLSALLSQLSIEWESVKVDKEGATPEQDAELERILSKYTELLN